MENRLEIPEDNFFAKGGNRLCYVDPRDSRRCLKVAMAHRTPEEKRKQARPWKRLRPIVYFDDNGREGDTYSRLQTIYGPPAFLHIPEFHGFVPTNLGNAICTDLIRDADGEISESMKSYLLKEGFTRSLFDALSVFTDWMQKHGIPTRHLLVHNIVVQREDDEKLQLYLIDGFGSSDPLPLVYKFRSLAKSKARRKVRAFRGRLDTFMQRNRLVYHTDPKDAFR